MCVELHGIDYKNIIVGMQNNKKKFKEEGNNSFFFFFPFWKISMNTLMCMGITQFFFLFGK